MVSSASPNRRRGRALFVTGLFMVIAGLGGLVLGLLLIDSLSDDLGATLTVSRSAVRSIGEGVEVAERVAEGTSGAVASAATAASSSALVTSEVSVGLDNLATFLENELPGDIDAIHQALPGAIGAADAIDRTLGALSLFGVDYSPEEPFGESLRRIEVTLDELPDDIESQSESLRRIVPNAETLARDIDSLASDLGELSVTLGDVNRLSQDYSETVDAAELAVQQTDDSLGNTVLLLRVLVVLAAAAAVVLGLSLITTDRRIMDIEATVATEPGHVVTTS